MFHRAPCILLSLLAGVVLQGCQTDAASSKGRATKGQIMALDLACRLFADDMGGGVGCWPPAAYTGAAGPRGPFPADGDHALVLWLTGYGPDQPSGGQTPRLNDATKSVNISTNPPDMLNADGKDGYGFRLAPQGRVYGPYGGTELFDKSMVGGYPVFVDAWGGTIHYDGHKIWAISPSGEEINNSTAAQ